VGNSKRNTSPNARLLKKRNKVVVKIDKSPDITRNTLARGIERIRVSIRSVL
jgi:hypothetical protein